MKLGLWNSLILLTLVTACTPQTLNFSTLNQQLPQLVVQADATVEALPDQLQMRLGVVTEAATANQALSENNQRMAAVMRMLEEIGIQLEEMKTGQFQIRPEWSVPPRPTPASWQRQIVGYQVGNELLIETGKVDLAGELLGLAEKAGANQIGGLQFSLADPEQQRLAAIELATRKARQKAKTLAAAAGAQLGEIMSLSLDGPGRIAGPQLMMAEARSAAADNVPVAAGKIEVAAGVTIVYRLLAQQGATE